MKSIVSSAIAVLAVLCVPAYAGTNVCQKAIDSKNYSAAYGACLQEAKKGNAAAQTNLSQLLVTGRGVDQDWKQAAEWLLKAADQGFAQAQLFLGIHYEEGMGVPQDYAQAMKWYVKAAENKNADAQLRLGWMFKFGRGIPQDYAQAQAWFRKAAEQGSTTAQYNLGLMYEEGLGVPQNYRQAMVWYRKAADLGHPISQFKVGLMYENGWGVTQDDREAIKWHRKAIEQHYSEGQKNLEVLTRRVKCKGATTSVFGVPLKCINRETLREAIKKAGGRPTRENNDYWYDTYASSALLDGSSKLLSGYTLAGDIAELKYEFQSFMDSGLVVKIKKMVESKYGRPRYSDGSPNLGPVTYIWTMGDGVEITVSRGWPDTTTYLSYVVPEYKAVMEEEIAKSNREAEAIKFNKQSGAF